MQISNSLGPNIGLYPIVPNHNYVRRFLAAGIKTIQLRVKDADPQQLRKEIRESVQIAQDHQAQLFINDYWQLAIDFQADGVHLGQEDLSTANWEQLRAAKIKIGISTHNPAEIKIALALEPSYLAFGPIYPTTSKQLLHPCPGIEQLAALCATQALPIVAIGGITWPRLQSILATKANGIAVISALLGHPNPEIEIRKWLNYIENFTSPQHN